MMDMIDAVDFNAVPFDEWRMDENRELEELLRLPDDLFTDAEKEKEELVSQSVANRLFTVCPDYRLYSIRQ